MRTRCKIKKTNYLVTFYLTFAYHFQYLSLTDARVAFEIIETHTVDDTETDKNSHVCAKSVY